jgi:hypothetical protein
MTAPASLFQKQFDSLALVDDAGVGSRIGRQLASRQSGMSSWVNIPLINSSGHPDDVDLRASRTQRETMYAADFPGSMLIVEWLRSQGFWVDHARIAVLFSSDLLRPHVDMHQSVRLLVQLNEHGSDFRHVFGTYCVAMQPGELWGVDGTVCHGAANLATGRERVMLILDCKLGSAPVWYFAPWSIPSSRILPRETWNQTTRIEHAHHAMEIAREQGHCAAEKEWLLIPYKYEIEPHAMYSELIHFCEQMASASKQSIERTLWASRASYWRAHDCVCVNPESLARSRR